MNLRLFTVLLLLVAQLAIAQDSNVPKKWTYDDYLDSVSALVSGRKFPEFSVNMNAPVTSNQDLVHKVVFVNFWFAGCPPCMAEMNALNKLYDTLKSNRDFVFLSITYDPEETTEKIIKKYGIRYPVIRMSKEETKRLNFQNGYPTSFILDRRGIIRYFKLGGSIDEDDAMPDVMQIIYPKILKQLAADDHESE